LASRCAGRSRSRLSRLVADQQAELAVKKADATREVVDNGLQLRRAFPEERVVLRQPSIEVLPLGHILMGCHPTTSRHRLTRDANEAAVGEFVNPA
jgi:hypothetical protein